MRPDHVASVVTLLKQASFTLKKLAEQAPAPAPQETLEVPATKVFSLDMNALRKKANEYNP